MGEGDAAVGDAEEEDFFRGGVARGNGGREPGDGGVNFLGADSLDGGHEARLRRVGRGVGRIFYREGVMRGRLIARPGDFRGEA